MGQKFVADFETTAEDDDCRVWAWAVAPMDSEEIITGTNIDDFMNYVREHLGTYYFHNLAFDGEFIVSWLLTHDYTYSPSAQPNTFNTLISQTGKWYQLEIYFDGGVNKKKKSAKFLDSLKKLPMGVARIAKSFDLTIQKGSIDYTAYRSPTHDLTAEEKEYVMGDVAIVRDALNVQFSQGLDKMTIGADALGYYKRSIPTFGEMFPTVPIPVDNYIRKCYRGGWTYVNPIYQTTESEPLKTVGEGMVFDVNSLYPSVMYDNPLPIGEPVPFSGRYVNDDDYPLYIQFISVAFGIRDNMLPMIQIKNSPYFNPRIYVTESPGVVELALTSVDMALFLEHYDVDILAYNGGLKFQERYGLFHHYINKWMDVKAHSTGGKRQIAKLMLNSLYGKFGTNPDVTPKIPYLREDGSVGFKLGKPDYRDPIYLPLAAFVTAYARNVTVRAAQANYDRFLYADTDSLHLLGRELPDLEIHPTKLGAWAHESNFRRGRYIRAKTYAEEIDGVPDKDGNIIECEPYLDVKCAGLPTKCKDQVTFDNFRVGLTVHGKLLPHHVKGGVILKEHDFTIK